MNTTQEQRKQFLLRKSAGDRIRPAYLSRLSHVLGREVTFLPLEVSDPVREKFFPQVKANEDAVIQSRVAVRHKDWDALHNFLVSLSKNAPSQELLVYLSEGDAIGAFSLPEDMFLINAVPLYREFHEVYAINPGSEIYAMMIDYFDDFYHGTEIFEAVFYGEARKYVGMKST